MNTYTHKYDAAIKKLDWRKNKEVLHLSDFSTRKNGLLIKSDIRTTTIDLATYLRLEHEELLKLIDTQELEKGILKHYEPGVIDVNDCKSFEYYWIPFKKIEKMIIELKRRG